MDAVKLLTIGFWLFLVRSEQSDAVGMQSQAILARDNTTMFCDSRQIYSVKWIHRLPGSTLQHLTVLHKNSFTTIETTENTSSLTLSPVRFRDAGSYECRILTKVFDGANVKLEEVVMYSQLIILASDPECNTSIPRSDITSGLMQNIQIAMSCYIEYNGNWSPIMEWQRQKDRKTVDLLDVNSSVTSKRVYSRIEVTTNLLTHGSVFSCRIHFGSMPNTVLSNASNIPEYNFTWTSPMFNVFYGSVNISIYPDAMEFFPGDNITCRADGNPSPSYTWRDLETGTVLGRDYTFEINQNMTRGDVFTLECVAGNMLSTASLSLRFMIKNSIPPDSINNNRTYLETAIIILTVLLLLSFAVIVIIVIAVKRNKPGIKEDPPPLQSMSASCDEIDDSKMTIDYQNKEEVIRAEGVVVCEVGEKEWSQVVPNLSNSRLEVETIVTDYSQLNETRMQMVRTTSSSEDFFQYSQFTGPEVNDVSQISSFVQPHLSHSDIQTYE